MIQGVAAKWSFSSLKIAFIHFTAFSCSLNRSLVLTPAICSRGLSDTLLPEVVYGNKNTSVITLQSSTYLFE